MKIIKTEIEGLFIIEPQVFKDSRGFFFESYSRRVLAGYGIDFDFVQDNHSRSVKGTVRGLHFQKNHPQDKIVRVISGEILDIAVDLRPDSPTFGKSQSFVLSSENYLQLFISKGFAHGFCVLGDSAEIIYKCSDFYYAEDEMGIRWNDPDLDIDWPVSNPILSARDSQNSFFKQLDFSSYSPAKGYKVKFLA